MFENDDMTLMDHFFEDNAIYEEELKEMAKKLISMGKSTGCRIQFFKENEGAPGDGLVAFWYKRMRMYCLRIGSACIILGDGGYKPPEISAYQEDALLNSKAQQMRKIAARINKAIIERDIRLENDGKITITDFAEFEI
ncbi:putative uncharacterized protein [Bacteroides sp. CAG:545]|nr:putative uncharacterized protein [Bacteroides sp. CAG:545]